MNLKKSTYRNTPLNRAIQQMQLKVIDDTYQKSYIYKAAQKSLKKPKSTEQQLRETTKKYQQITASKMKSIFVSGLSLKTTFKNNIFCVLMTEIIPKKAQFGCCSDGKTVVNVVGGDGREVEIWEGKGKDGGNGQLLYRFNFNTVEARVESYDIDDDSFMLDICHKIVLKFQNIKKNSKTAQSLKQALNNMIKDSLGTQFHMQKITELENFHKIHYKSCTQFAQNCETGDLLLFRGSLFWAKFQRFISNSDYDHVGILYKDPIHGILIFQATSVSGICLTPWNFVVKYKWYQFIQRIMWRRLEGVERDQQFLEDMRQLIVDKVGKSYHISLDKLLSNQSYIYSKPLKSIPQQPSSQPSLTKIASTNSETSQNSQNPKKSEQVGYFCSELVAKMYKNMKLLTSNKEDNNFKPSCNFYPYHFTQKFKLQMLNGANLSPQFVIAFDAKEIQNYYGE